jgi:uncharacterized cofD-like protein
MQPACVRNEIPVNTQTLVSSAMDGADQRGNPSTSPQTSTAARGGMRLAHPDGMIPNESSAASLRARPRHSVAQEEHRSPAPSPRVVAIGGGTGLPAVLDGLCSHSGEAHVGDVDRITAVVTVTDEGGSSGELRRSFGVLPPGDVRNCLAAVAGADSPFRQLLQHRFSDAQGFEGHPVGNLLLTALTQITGDFARAVDELSTMIGLRGRVLPTTSENVRLRAEMADGRVLTGETGIVSQGVAIRRLWLEPRPRPLPDVLRALVNAEGIVVGPGSLYTSVLPNLLVEGIAATVFGVNAVRIYVANLMTEPGETDGYTLDDHLEAIRSHAGFDLFDYIVVNRRPIDGAAAARYAAQGAYPVTVELPLRWAGCAQIIECDLAPEYGERKIRHDAHALAQVIHALVRAGRRRPE